MNQESLETLIKIIDRRIEKKLSESKFLSEYLGTIVEKPTEEIPREVKVKLANGETIFTFRNKTNLSLGLGDNVCIQTSGNDLNTGIVSRKF